MARKGLSRILIEGGSEIYTSFLKANLVDEMMIYRSPKIIGLEGLPMFSKIHMLDKFKLINKMDLYPDTFEVWINNRVVWF